MSSTPPALAPTPFVLPARLIGRSHIARILREIEAVDSYMSSQAIRSPEVKPVVPGISRVLRELLDANQAALIDQKERQRLLKLLRKVKDAAPQVHMTFAIEPDVIILTDVVKWLRENTHEHALVSVGVQPNIVGGCVVRTPDKVYDLSFQKHFSGLQSTLRDALVKVAA